ncbi:MAG: hypothetical protein R3330_07305, partial [Saprospiraceae bacterium]|nr:hypothetical protein [Saprospiraceae bacterium]
MTDADFTQQLIDRYQLQDAVKVMASNLSRPELTSVLLRVFRERAAGVIPAALMTQMQDDRFVRPSTVPQEMFAWFDQTAFDLLPDWESIDLSPVAPLGTSSALGPVDQSLIVATSRGQEVMSDCTNVLALIAARKRGRARRTNIHASVRLCTSQRLTRAGALNDPLHTAHFRVFTLVSAGRDVGGMGFETRALIEHIKFYSALTKAICGSELQGLALRVLEYAPTGVDWMQVFNTGNDDSCPVTTEHIDSPGWDYYHPLQFKIRVSIAGSSL